MNPVVAKVKPFAFTGTGAAVGAAAGGPIGLGVGVGIGALLDWWRHKRARTMGALAEPPVMQPAAQAPITQVSPVHLLPIQMQQNLYAPATLDAITKIKSAAIPASHGIRVSFPPARPAPPKKPPPPKKPQPPKPPIVASVSSSSSSSSGSGSGEVDFTAQGSFSLF